MGDQSEPTETIPELGSDALLAVVGRNCTLECRVRGTFMFVRGKLEVDSNGVFSITVTDCEIGATSTAIVDPESVTEIFPSVAGHIVIRVTANDQALSRSANQKGNDHE